MTIDTSPRETDQRNRWPNGLVRHLRLDATLKPEHMWAIRVQTGPVRDGIHHEIYYTLVMHPDHEHEADDMRYRVERNPDVGGLFGPDRDL
jgi:hypothetical protein